MKNWLQEYQHKLISPEEAANLVKSGDFVAFTMGREALSVGLALAGRKEELRNVEIFIPTPGYDFGWYDAGWEESFKLTVAQPSAVCQEAIDAGRCDILAWSLYPGSSLTKNRIPDVLITEVSPPDERGFCSFGASLWDKKRQVRNAKLVIAEVNKGLIRTYGDNYIHVSEIDYFVESKVSWEELPKGTLAGREAKEPEPYHKDIAGYISELIKDGDTLQIGVGRTTEPLALLGAFDNKHDLGFHSETTPPGIISLVRRGVITGRRKTINTGKVVVTALGGGTEDELEWANNNPIFELVDVDYVEDIKVIAAHDNMVAINNALAVDLKGQINAETVGARLYSGAGGQIIFVIGALLSRGGRSITVLPSTAARGTVSRIVPALPEGAVVTLQQYLADYVVTEYGIASLRGKPLRKRAEELISVSHPDFRGQLKKALEKL